MSTFSSLSAGDPAGPEHAIRSDPLPNHLHGLRQIHRGLRRDAQRLQGAVRVLPARAGVIQGWWDRVCAVLDWHLVSKEQLLYPALRRSPGWTDSHPLLLDDHTALRAAGQSVTRALAQAADGFPRIDGASESLSSIATWFEELLLAHLMVAERLLWPAIEVSMTRTGFLAIQRRVLLSAGPSTMTFLAPWVLDGLDDQAAPGVLDTMPPPVRILSRTALAWRYQRWRWW